MSQGTWFFEFEKCSTDTYPFDNDCGNVDPYEINYEIIVEITIPQNPIPVTNSDIQLQVEIGNACEQNVLTIVPNGPPITYWLRTPAEVYDHQVLFTQTYSFCPFRCDLYRMMGPMTSPYPTDIIRSWYPYTGAFQARTDDKTLAG